VRNRNRNGTPASCETRTSLRRPAAANASHTMDDALLWGGFLCGSRRQCANVSVNMLGRGLGRLGSAVPVLARSHSSGGSQNTKEDTEKRISELKKLTKVSPSKVPEYAKRYSSEPLDPSVPVSEAIRRRILKSGARFHSNDNISEYVREDEFPLLVEEVARNMQGVLKFECAHIPSIATLTSPAARLSSIPTTITTPPTQRGASLKCL
jgi:hypothetical protein